MDLAGLRVNNVVQLGTEPLAPLVVGASEFIVDAKLARDGSGQVKQTEWLAERQARYECIRRTFANIKRTGPGDVVGAELCLPGRRHDMIGDINPMVGISPAAIHKIARRSEPVGSRHLPGPDG